MIVYDIIIFFLHKTPTQRTLRVARIDYVNSNMNPKYTKSAKHGLRLFKRGDDGKLVKPGAPFYQDRPYYYTFQHAKRTHTRCLKTNDAQLAQRLARAFRKEIIEAVICGDLDRLDATKLRQPKPAVVATVARLCDAYKVAPGNANPKSRKTNLFALQQVLRNGHPDATTDELQVTQINKSLARQWFQSAKTNIDAEPDQRAQASLIKSANSRFKQAKSLFTPPARACYQELGIDNECFDEFVLAFKMFKLKESKQSESFDPPSDLVIEQTLRDWLTVSDRNLFVAIGHELAFGLRAGELRQATWSWWSERSGYPVIDASASVKNLSGRLHVRALDPYFSQMLARLGKEGWRGAKDDFILTGTMTDRSDLTFRAVSSFLRSHSWKTNKTNHALRAFAGSQIMMRYGSYEAQCWLRHSSVDITERFYSYFVKRFKPADVTTMETCWAVIPAQAPALRIFEAPGTTIAPSDGPNLVPQLRMVEAK